MLALFQQLRAENASSPAIWLTLNVGENALNFWKSRLESVVRDFHEKIQAF